MTQQMWLIVCRVKGSRNPHDWQPYKLTVGATEARSEAALLAQEHAYEFSAVGAYFEVPEEVADAQERISEFALRDTTFSGVFRGR